VSAVHLPAARVAGRLRWPHSPEAALAVGVTVLLWASAFVGIRAVVGRFSPISLAIVRYFVASLVLATVLVVNRTELPPLRVWPRLALVGLMGISVYNVALNFGSTRIPAASASFLVNTAPIFTAILAMVLLGEVANLVVYAGMLLGFVGATLIVLGEGSPLQFGLPALLIVLAAIAQSLYFTVQKPLLQRYTPLQVVAVAVWLGTLFMLPLAGDTIRSWAVAPWDVRLLILYLGVFPAALAYVSWSYALSRMKASVAASFLYCVPPTTLLLGWVLLHEAPTLLSIGGGLVALCGVSIVGAGRRAPARQTVIAAPEGTAEVPEAGSSP
jgi:drug/metabolite transporter (DMT)-like permease